MGVSFMEVIRWSSGMSYKVIYRWTDKYAILEWYNVIVEINTGCRGSEGRLYHLEGSVRFLKPFKILEKSAYLFN